MDKTGVSVFQNLVFLNSPGFAPWAMSVNIDSSIVKNVCFIATATRSNIKRHDCSKVLQLFLNNNLFVKICP